MSWKAQGWAIEQKTGSSSNKWVLMVLASFADDKNECFPSFKTICNITELSKSTVIRCIKDLERTGFIKTQERYVDFQDAKRQTSNLYKLEIDGCQTDTNGSYDETHPSVMMKSHITSHNKPIYTEEFNNFWNMYPRKEGSKKKAFEIWDKITKSVITKKELFNFCQKFNKLNKGKDIKYIPHLTTWLNQRRWETINEEEKKTKFNLNQLVG
jgi:DNA-binding transcriptional regulator YhcF (GntR family)